MSRALAASFLGLPDAHQCLSPSDDRRCMTFL